jgi:hypothetical protein
MRMAVIKPDNAVSPAISHIAAVNPNTSAVMPANKAPMA